jgi:hypothetical protein
VTDYFKNDFQRRAYAEAYAKWEEGNRLGMDEHRKALAWPSTSRETVEGARGAVSKLGGQAVERSDDRRK